METTKRGTWSSLVAIALFAVAIAGCGGGDDGTQVADPVPTSVEISPGSATLGSINATQGFTAVVRDQDGKAMPNAAVSWSSSDASVFLVTGSGSTATVTAAGNGTGTLTATSGQASGTASVEVEQVVARMEMVSGDDEEAVRGTALAEPVVVRVEDQGGTVVEGVTVTFLPDEGHGSVSETMVDTDADGMASTEWTLGVDDRRQSLIAFSGDATIRFSASATSDPPIPDLVLTTLTLSRTEPTVYETVDIEAVITNEGDGAGPATFPVRLSLGGQPVEAIDIEALEPGASTTVEFTVGPLEEGRYLVDFALDPDDEIEEWEEGNNSGSGNIFVQGQQVISLDEPVTVQSTATGLVLLYRIEIEEASDEALNVQLSGGTGDADLFGHYGDRPDHHYSYRCLSGNADANELCQMVPTRAGTYHIAVHAFTAFGPSTLTVTVGGRPVAPYDIDLVFVAGGTTSQNNIIEQAAERWESVIARDVYDRNPAIYGILAANHCGPNSAVSDIIDDIRVFVSIDSIDGAGNGVGRSQPCAIQDFPFGGATGILQPRTGRLLLDEDDVARLESEGVLLSVVTHELAHVLGFHPRVWAMRDQLRNSSLGGNPDADTHFAGQVTIPAFDAAGGDGYGGAKVPLENGGVAGVSDSHWRASVFGDELMSPMLTGDEQPLSLITIEALYDIWYEINPAAADAFSLSGAGAAGMALPRGLVIDLRGDIGDEYPITVSRPLRKRRK